MRRLRVVRTAVDADASAAKESYDCARRELREFKESRDAGFIFRALKPQCCPSCDEVITEQHRRETEEQHVCAVCGTPDRPQDEGLVVAQEERLVTEVEEAKSEWETQDARAQSAGQDVVDQEARLLAAERACREAEQAVEDPNHTWRPSVTASGWRPRLKSCAVPRSWLAKAKKAIMKSSRLLKPLRKI